MKQAKYYINSFYYHSEPSKTETNGSISKSLENEKYLESILKKVTIENEKLKQEGVEKRTKVQLLTKEVEKLDSALLLEEPSDKSSILAEYTAAQNTKFELERELSSLIDSNVTSEGLGFRSRLIFEILKLP